MSRSIGRLASAAGVARIVSAERVVVAGVDGSPAAEWALQWAADEAARRHAVLRVVHAGDHRFGRPGGSGGPRVLSEAVDRATARQPLVTVRATWTSEAPALALVEASELAELLVVGVGGGWLAELVLGSVSRYCLRHAACPVAVVSHRPPAVASAAAGPVVVGVDGSAGADAALRWALDEAPSLGSPVRAMFCWQYPPVGSFLPGPAEGYRARAEEVVARATAKAAAWRPDVGCSVEERFGDPADVLLEAAATASLLVLGSRPPHDLHDLLGSVPEQCSRASACPLVVVRGRAG